MIHAVPKPAKRGPKARAPQGLKRAAMRKTSVRSKKSGGHLFYKTVDEDRRAFIQGCRCAVTGAATGEWIRRESWMPKTLPVGWVCFVVCAHVKARGAAGPDVGNMIPLDSRMHEWQGQIGWPAFERRLKLEPRQDIAAEYERRYLAGVLP